MMRGYFTIARIAAYAGACALAACSGGGPGAPFAYSGGTGASVSRISAGTAQIAAKVKLRRALAEPTCSGSGAGSFVGVNNTNVALGVDSVVVGGGVNYACAFVDAVVGGEYNGIDTISSDSNIGGGDNNTISGGYQSTIGGGGSNVMTGQTSVIGGGGANDASNFYDTIAGGTDNATSQFGAAIGGGNENKASGEYGTIAGGDVNGLSGNYGAIAGGYNGRVAGEFASVGGGESNQASGEFATVPGGQANVAHGEGSFAAGMGSNAADNGDFVWSDVASGATAISVTGDNEFLARARGGVTFYSSANLASGVKLAAGSGTWSSLSDRNAKTAILPLNDDERPHARGDAAD